VIRFASRWNAREVTCGRARDDGPAGEPLAVKQYVFDAHVQARESGPEPRYLMLERLDVPGPSE
jgi:hypothetical protein